MKITVTDPDTGDQMDVPVAAAPEEMVRMSDVRPLVEALGYAELIIKNLLPAIDVQPVKKALTTFNNRGRR